MLDGKIDDMDTIGRLSIVKGGAVVVMGVMAGAPVNSPQLLNSPPFPFVSVAAEASDANDFINDKGDGSGPVGDS